VEKLIKKACRREGGRELRTEVKKLTSKELVIKLVGEDHTLGNLIAKHALNHPHVRLAAYTIEHPLEGSPTIRIVTDGEVHPLEVFKEVIKDTRGILEELLKTLNTSLGIEE